MVIPSYITIFNQLNLKIQLLNQTEIIQIGIFHLTQPLFILANLPYQRSSYMYNILYKIEFNMLHIYTQLRIYVYQFQVQKFEKNI